MADFQDNAASGKTWIRGLYMVLFFIILSIAKVLIGLLAFVQFLFALIKGVPNLRLRRFGGQMAIYCEQIIHYLSFCRDEKPFPFNDWPDEPSCYEIHDEDEEEEKRETKNSKEMASQAADTPENEEHYDHERETSAT